MTIVLHEGDCLDVLKQYDDNHFDLVFTSPPYEAARTYGIDFNLRGDDWVNWAFDRYIACRRVCKGLVAWVVEGQTRQFGWSATPIKLMNDLHDYGVKLRKPPIFHRVGIPGSGGPDWWRNDYEFIVCASKGKLPWSDNTATGHPCKYPPGGKLSHRNKDGERLYGHSGRSGDHETNPNTGQRGIRRKNGSFYTLNKANPGNVLKCTVGGGQLGSKLAHENEAPFPEALVEPFVKCFCPPGGLVLDPFCGSGTTLAVAERLGRRAVGIDVRASQIDLSKRRVAELTTNPVR